MTIRFDGRVAIVTGAGAGLGRSHALALAARGAKLVVNDLGASVAGVGGNSAAALGVVREIEALGGEAIANGANVADFQQVEAMVAEAKQRWGRVDILINNAGILRDKTFAKMTLDDFSAVVSVHLMGAVHCCKAVWETMREQNYGRILLTASGSGLYGNFGQANYAAAKAAMIGLMNVLDAEGGRHGVRVNALAPTAATRMTAGILPEAALALMTPEAITPGVLTLVDEDAPSRTILAAGAGCFSVTRIIETEGVYLSEAERSPENIRARFAEICDPTGAREPKSALAQTEYFLQKASGSATRKAQPTS